MMSKGLLLARPVGNLILRRGKAVQNYKRPTMDEYLGPKEPWAKVPFIYFVSTFRGVSANYNLCLFTKICNHQISYKKWCLSANH